MSNEAEHLGRLVRIVRGKHHGSQGRLVKVYTAKLHNAGPRDANCRDVFYNIETSDVLILGAGWEDFLQLPRQ